MYKKGIELRFGPCVCFAAAKIKGCLTEKNEPEMPA